jgi:UDP-N-acetylglucosamine:LPS N-acetylglucosamine transferase
MEQASRKLARPDATERIADMIEKLAAAQAGVAAQDVSF